MSYFVSFLISLAISVVCSVISYLLAPKTKTTSPSPGELEAPDAKSGTPIPHVRGTRFVAVNCLWWQPEGTTAIRM